MAMHSNRRHLAEGQIWSMQKCSLHVIHGGHRDKRALHMLQLICRCSTDSCLLLQSLWICTRCSHQVGRRYGRVCWGQLLKVTTGVMIWLLSITTNCLHGRPGAMRGAGGAWAARCGAAAATVWRTERRCRARCRAFVHLQEHATLQWVASVQVQLPRRSWCSTELYGARHCAGHNSKNGMAAAPCMDGAMAAQRNSHLSLASSRKAEKARLRSGCLQERPGG